MLREDHSTKVSGGRNSGDSAYALTEVRSEVTEVAKNSNIFQKRKSKQLMRDLLEGLNVLSSSLVALTFAIKSIEYDSSV